MDAWEFPGVPRVTYRHVIPIHEARMSEHFTWLNEPAQWAFDGGRLTVTTDRDTDFWQDTWYGFQHANGHFFGTPVSGDFTFQVKVEGAFDTLYDQAGVMLHADDRHWLKAGIEFNDDQPAIGSVLTAGRSDWATGTFHGDPRRFWMRLTRRGDALRLQYSADGRTWPLLRLAAIDPALPWQVGVMCCSPTRAGLSVAFSEMALSPPNGKDLHDLS